MAISTDHISSQKSTILFQRSMDCIKDFLEYLNRLLIDLGYLKPTMIYGVMTRRNQNAPLPKCYRHWTPEFCIRAGDRRKMNQSPGQTSRFDPALKLRVRSALRSSL